MKLEMKIATDNLKQQYMLLSREDSGGIFIEIRNGRIDAEGNIWIDTNEHYREYLEWYDYHKPFILGEESKEEMEGRLKEAFGEWYEYFTQHYDWILHWNHFNKYKPCMFLEENNVIPLNQNIH